MYIWQRLRQETGNAHAELTACGQGNSLLGPIYKHEYCNGQCLEYINFMFNAVRMVPWFVGFEHGRVRVSACLLQVPV